MHALCPNLREPSPRRRPAPRQRGFTLIELMIVVGILGTLAAIAIPTYVGFIYKAKVVRAVSEIKQMSTVLSAYGVEHGELPDSLADVPGENLDEMLDPWEHPYVYLNIQNAHGKGSMRKDRFLVPLNSDYDLYSMGKDGDSKSPLSAPQSKDDIIRANNGNFVGLAVNF